MTAVFVELPAFERHRGEYLDDTAFRGLQDLLMKHPEAGDPIPETGGLRKLRYADARRERVSAVIYGWSIVGGMPGFSSGFAHSTTRTR